MTEELMDESTFAHMSPSRQRELIASYCADMERRIVSASTTEEAATLVENACGGFRKDCTSSLVAEALSEHVRRLFQQYWGS